MIPRAALEQEREQEAIATIALRGVRRVWRRMARGNWERNWRDDVGPNIQQVVLQAQSASATSADAYVAAVLAELGIEPEVPTALNVDALVGVGGDGRPVESLTYGAVIESVKAQYKPGVLNLPPDQALQEAMDAGQTWMDAAIATILADTARAAETASTAQRTWVTGYVRMIEPGACSRCVILAGKRYRWNEGFLRHPRCRCRHIPAAEAMAGDLTTDPQVYFDSLPKGEQDRVFTTAGAEAVRLGADLGQVVNARRGMRTAQVYGRKALITTEGATARGLAGKRLGELGKEAGSRYRRSRTPRLMPETILAEAKSPADAVRLLKRFGYIL